METLLSIVPVLVPFDVLNYEFMQLAFIGLLLLAPITAMMGVQVVNFGMAFYTDAISHTAFAGVAVGVLLGISPWWSMPFFGVMVGLSIVLLQRRSKLGSDTVIGVLFSGVLAFGLAIVSRTPGVKGDMSRFLYGDILTITGSDLCWLLGLSIVIIVYQAWGYNRLLYIGLNPLLASTHRVKVAWYQYSYAALLALVVIFSVWWVGVLLVTGMLIVPAATARNITGSSRAMFWLAIGVSLLSAVLGLLISAQSWAETATGATIVLVSSILFGFSWVYASLFRQQRNG